MPSFKEMLLSFSAAAIKHVKSGMAQASDEEKEKRASICESCEFLDQEKYTCKACGCKLKYKIAWETSKCVKEKW